jgi:hypothetical protein
MAQDRRDVPTSSPILLRKFASFRARILDLYGWTFGALRTHLRPYFADLKARKRYRVLSIDEMQATRKGDRVFIFGSGASIKRISPAEWEHFSQFDTFSYSHFGRNRKIPIRFHMVAEIFRFGDFLEIYRDHPLYRDTIYIVQEGWAAEMGNRFVASGVIEKGRPIFRFRRTRRGQIADPTQSIEQGVVHTANSITDMVNLAYLIGWKEIVLVGVDLTDKRYFYLGDQETHPSEIPGITYATPFPGGDVVSILFKKWRSFFEANGVQLVVYNPHSLLAGDLPIYDRRQIPNYAGELADEEQGG